MKLFLLALPLLKGLNAPLITGFGDMLQLEECHNYKALASVA